MAGPERKPHMKDSDLPLSPLSLLIDNKSDTALANLENFHRAERSGGLILAISCGDARVSPSLIFRGNASIATLHAVAAAPPLESFEDLLKNPGIAGFVVIEHYDGQAFKESGKPKGCGGLGARAQIEDKLIRQLGVPRFVQRRLKSDDVVIQGLAYAKAIFELTGKPTLATTVDHLTDRLSPFAFLSKSGQSVPTGFEGDLLDPSSLYPEGIIPTIGDEKLSKKFRLLLSQNRQHADEIEDQYPDFRKTQKIQNPKIAFLSSSRVPAAIRYPATLSKPNTGFIIALPYVKEIEQEGEERWIDLPDLDEAFEQVHFPISTCIEADPGESFSDTTTILVETPSLDLSYHVAKELDRRQWIQRWRQKTDGTIMYAQVNAGRVEGSILKLSENEQDMVNEEDF